MYHPIEAIDEKLKRANENIINLDSEISVFIEKNKGPFVGNKDVQKILDAAQAFNDRIPIRFSVLAGEVIHQLRSSLDHIAWALANSYDRRHNAEKIIFPVCAEESKKSGCDGKVQLIASPQARSLVRECQPYLRPDPFAEPLWVLHDLDRLYKHRAIQLGVATFDLGSPSLNTFAWLHAADPTKVMTPALARKIQEKFNAPRT